MATRFSIEATSMGLVSALRSGYSIVPPTGPYTAARYWPKANRDAYLQLLGLRRNPMTGLYEGDLYKPDEPVW